MNLEELRKRYLEELNYPNEVAKKFWDELSEEMKNDYINRGKIDRDELLKLLNRTKK